MGLGKRTLPELEWFPRALDFPPCSAAGFWVEASYSRTEMQTRVVIGVFAILLSVFLVANLKRSLQLPLPSSSGNQFASFPTGTRGHSSRESIGARVRESAFSLQSSNRSVSEPKQQRIFLIHVGKTGGETVRHTLRVTCRMRKNEVHQKACLDSFRVNNRTVESALSKHTIGTMHCDLKMPKKGMERATTFLWTIRNPIDRIKSWYRYINPANCRPLEDYYSTACNTNRSLINQHSNSKGSKWAIKFFACFPSMTQFAEALTLPGSIKESNHIDIDTIGGLSNCSQLAWRTILGKASPSSGHSYFNYKYYWRETIGLHPHTDTWIIRTEYLWEDMDGIEQMLLQSSNQRLHSVSHPHSNKRNVTHGSEGHAQKGELSSLALGHLCCALKEEIVIYGNLLFRATNLEDVERYKSLDVVATQCGADSWRSINDTLCNDLLP